MHCGGDLIGLALLLHHVLIGQLGDRGELTGSATELGAGGGDLGNGVTDLLDKHIKAAGDVGDLIFA